MRQQVATSWGFRCVACAAAFVIGIAAAQSVPDRVSNVEKAATEIAAIQSRTGADGAFAAINECYRREVAGATSLTREVEACVAQDIIVSKVSAAFYARLNPEGRRMAGAPEPEAVLKAMAARVIGAFARLKVPENETRAFNQIVETKGMEAYGRARFPGQFPPKQN
jgi:hypothetical protein